MCPHPEQGAMSHSMVLAVPLQLVHMHDSASPSLAAGHAPRRPAPLRRRLAPLAVQRCRWAHPAAREEKLFHS